MQEFFENRKVDYTFKLQQFEGPLDLLLELIGKAEVSIKDIFVSDITEQYLAYINAIGELDVDKASSFASYAGRLLDIKVRSILPKDEEETIQLDEDKSNIIYELQMREIMKTAAEEIKPKETCNKFYWEPEYTDSDYRCLLTNFDLDALINSFAKILHKADIRSEQKANVKIIPKDKFTVLDKTKELIVLLKEKKEIRFFGLFDNDYTKSEKINTFLALLELLKRQFVVVQQDEPFEDILLQLKEGADKLKLEEVLDGQFDEYN